MPQNMSSLMSQPSQATPPEADPQQSGQQQQGPQSLQNLMQENPGAAMEPGADGRPAPNFQMTIAALKHMRMFANEWEKLLKIDDIGKVDIKGEFIKGMATLMGERIVTLPQTLQMMKGFPDNPLQQRQWVQEHYARDRAAKAMIMQQHARAFPIPDHSQPGLKNGYDHAGMMTDLVQHYKKLGKDRTNA